jgi:hypothetical protein
VRINSLHNKCRAQLPCRVGIIQLELTRNLLLTKNENKLETSELVNSPSILTSLEYKLRRMGFAGSANIPQLIYLCLQTRRFGKPVSLIIKGPSGSGKSFALSSALKFVPEASYEHYSGMSEKAIIYSGLDLQNKHLVIGEAAGLSSGNGRAFLRQLISEGSIKYMTVQSTDKGVNSKVLPPIKGPCGLIMTTTANSLHPEDESRMLTVNINESSEQIKQALLAQARGKSRTEDVNFDSWHSFDRMIGEGVIDVDIPFAEQLAEALPTTHFRVQRDFPHLLSLIATHALLHKYMRSVDDNGRIIATIHDYAEVHRLVSGPISEGLEMAVPATVREIVEAVAKLAPDSSKDLTFGFNGEGVSQREISDLLKRDQSVISRNAHSAIEQGYLVNLNPGQGREAKLVLGERELPKGYALPTPEQLQILLAS